MYLITIKIIDNAELKEEMNFSTLKFSMKNIMFKNSRYSFHIYHFLLKMDI